MDTEFFLDGILIGCLANSPAGETGSQSFLFDAVTLTVNANKLMLVIFNIFYMESS